jgi:DNA-directed RNA polymerase subunit K/omega
MKRRAGSLKDFGNVDSKYRFVIIASLRAKELLKGAKSRLKSKSRNPIRIAQSEVKLGLVEYEIIQAKKEELPEIEERVFLGEQVGGEFEDEHEGAAAESPKEEGHAAGDEGEGPGVDFTHEFEPLGETEEEEKEEEAEEEEEKEEGGKEDEEG